MVSLEDKVGKIGHTAARLDGGAELIIGKGYTASAEIDHEAHKHYFMGEWNVEGKFYMFIDDTCPGTLLTTEITPGHTIAVQDILIEEGMHRIEMQIKKGGQTYKYSTKMHEKVLELFGSYGDHYVDLDEKRPNLGADERRAIEAIPNELVRNILLCTITRPLPGFSFESKQPDYN